MYRNARWWDQSRDWQAQYPSAPLQLYFSIQPVSTRFQLFYRRTVEKSWPFRIPPQRNDVFNPHQSRTWSGYAKNVNTEMRLQNRYFALQRADQAVYVSSSKSELHRYDAKHPVEQPHEGLFDNGRVDGSRGAPPAYGERLFGNSTRQQLRTLPLRHWSVKKGHYFLCRECQSRRSARNMSSRRTFRRKSDRRTRPIDEYIREKHAEYRLALEQKAEKYGYLDSKSGQLVLGDEHFFQTQGEKHDGEWVHQKQTTPAADDLPDITLQEREDAPNRHLQRSLQKCLRSSDKGQRETEKLETRDVDINNAILTMQSVSQSKRGHPYHDLEGGGNEVHLGLHGTEQRGLPPYCTNAIEAS